jgi:hypothetical protein
MTKLVEEVFNNDLFLFAFLPRNILFDESQYLQSTITSSSSAGLASVRRSMEFLLTNSYILVATCWSRIAPAIMS